jgi:DNA-directed RNA polymerase specialized sigma24 family protein
MQAEGEVVRLPAALSPSDFRVFFEDEHRGLLKVLHFVTGDRAEAADLMQEAFLKVWERWDRIDEIDDPRAYLFRIALNGSKMRARAARRASRRMLPIRGPSATRSTTSRSRGRLRPRHRGRDPDDRHRTGGNPRNGRRSGLERGRHHALRLAGVAPAPGPERCPFAHRST